MRTIFVCAALVAAFSVSAAGQIIVSADLYKTPDSPLDSFNLSDAVTLSR
jgi:hypothetical protein